MTAWTFTLPFEKPPIGLSMNYRGHWGARAKSTAQVRLMVLAEVRRLAIPTLDRCQVDVVWVVRDRRRRDADNFSYLTKAIFDGIGSDTGVSAHIVTDDAPQFMVKPGATIRYDKTATAHFEITITSLARLLEGGEPHTKE